MKTLSEKSFRAEVAFEGGTGAVSPPTAQEPFDIRVLIRRCVRESPPRSDPATIAECVVRQIPEEHLREVVARWLPSHVDTEMFNMHAEKIARGL